MTGTDIDVHIEHLGISIVANPQKPEDKAQPNQLLNAFSDFFNNINNVRGDTEKGGKPKRNNFVSSYNAEKKSPLPVNLSSLLIFYN